VARPGLRKTYRYSEEFKATAVKLSALPDVRIQDVADALDIHPFMLSRWRKELRAGRIVARKRIELDEGTAAELTRLKKLEREHAILKMEHDLLKKAIQFTSERRKKSSSSSTNGGENTP